MVEQKLEWNSRMTAREDLQGRSLDRFCIKDAIQTTRSGAGNINIPFKDFDNLLYSRHWIFRWKELLCAMLVCT
jgi:hypothetical protein